MHLKPTRRSLFYFALENSMKSSLPIPKQEMTFWAFGASRIGGVQKTIIRTPSTSGVQTFVCFSPWWRSWFLEVATPPKWFLQFWASQEQSGHCRCRISPRASFFFLLFYAFKFWWESLYDFITFPSHLTFQSRCALNPCRVKTILSDFTFLTLQKWASRTRGVQNLRMCTPAIVRLTLFSSQFLGRSPHSYFFNTPSVGMPCFHFLTLCVTSGGPHFDKSQKWHAQNARGVQKNIGISNIFIFIKIYKFRVCLFAFAFSQRGSWKNHNVHSCQSAAKNFMCSAPSVAFTILTFSTPPLLECQWSPDPAPHHVAPVIVFSRPPLWESQFWKLWWESLYYF